MGREHVPVDGRPHCSTVYSWLYKQYVNLSSLFKAGGKVWLVSIIQLAPAGRFSNYTIWLSLLMAVAVNSEGFVFLHACNILQIANISSFYSRCFTSAWSFFCFFLRLLKALKIDLYFHLLTNVTRYLHKHYSYTHPVHMNMYRRPQNIIETNRHHFYMTETGYFYKTIIQNTICNCWSIYYN